MFWRKKWFVLLIFLFIGCGLKYTFAQPVIFPKPLSPRIANYDIDVTLDTEHKKLTGHEVLTWYNKTGDTINELQFHLYLNAFRNTNSTYMIESGRKYLTSERKKERWGYIEIDSIATAHGINLAERLEFIHPDVDDVDDKTVVRLPLDRPLRSGQSISVTIDFTAVLPEPPIARSGAKKEYFFVAQWFPKIGVYLDGEWNCHQYHSSSEFFADFGVYNVRMTVPEENVLGATGIEVEVKNNGDGTATHFYHAEDVHDFAWTTSPDFVVFTEHYEGVDIRVLMQKDHARQGQRYLDAAKVGLKYYQEWFTNYPYSNLTVVDPRRGASATGGMEYPTFIAGATGYRMPKGVRLPEMVVVHEFGHNIWYHLVATNEFEEAWLDEGINTYSELLFMNEAYGPTGDIVDVLGIQFNDLQYQRGAYLFCSNTDPVVKNAWDFYSRTSYGINSYMKPGLMLVTLHNYLGAETMKEIMHTYAERWRFKHPQTQDFIDVVNEIAGQDLTWFFDQALFSTKELDYSVDYCFTRKVTEPQGYDYSVAFGEDSSSIADSGSVQLELEEESANAGEESLSTETASDDSSEVEEEPKMYYSGVNLRRLGDFTFPVEVEITFDNGEILHESWDGKDYWKKFRYIKPAKLVSAKIDPNGKILIDLNFTNNSYSIEEKKLGVTKLSARLLFWFQFLLDQPSFINLLTSIQSIVM